MTEDYVMQAGDCVLSIAQERGFLWKTLWNHPKNQSLASQRKDPNVVLPGDVLHIPDLEPREESAATEQRHTFRVWGRRAKLRLKLTRSARDDEVAEHSAAALGEYTEPPARKAAAEPEAEASYVLYVDGERVTEGKTDAEGRIEADLPPRAKAGRLVVNPGEGTRERVIELNLGHMDPVAETAGVCKRLNNLGYECPEDAADESAELADALKAFQADHDLDVSGKADESTRDKLKEVHGG